MAVFNAPLNVPSHSAACIEATLLMQEKLAELRVKWTAQGLPEVQILTHSLTHSLTHLLRYIFVAVFILVMCLLVI